MYHKANKIKKKFKINNKSTILHLKEVIRKLGCNISTYSEEHIKLSLLGLTKETKTAPAISVKDKNGDITVYYNDLLPISKQRFALAHEIGHLVLGHIYSPTGNKKQENEANRFAKYLLTPSDDLDLYISFICIFLSIVIIMFAILIFNDKPNEITNESTVQPSISVDSNPIVYDTICYYTPNSTVYHLDRDCYYIKTSRTVYTGTVSTCGLSRLCSACERKHKQY